MFCPECGKKNLSNANFCQECGSAMPLNHLRQIGVGKRRSEKREIEKLIKNLNSYSSDKRNRAVDGLVKIGEPAFDSVSKATRSPNSSVRRKTCDVLSRMNHPRANSHLIRLLTDSDIYVRRRAANALIHIGDKSAVQALIKALSDEESKVRSRAATALGKIGDERAIDGLIAASTDSNSTVRDESLIALRKIGWEPKKDERSVKFLISQKRFNEVARICEELAIDPLINEFNSYSSETRNKAVDALVRFIGEPAVDPLIKALDSDDEVIRRKTCDALGLLKDSRSVIPLTKLLKDKDNYVQRRAANALITVNNEDAVDPLIHAAFFGPDSKLRIRSIQALGEIGDIRAVDNLIYTSKDTNKEISQASLTALKKIGWKPTNDERSINFLIGQKRYYKCVEIGQPAIKPLINELNSNDRERRNGAVHALVKIGEPAVNPLINALNSAIDLRRRKACDALGLIGDPKAVIPLTKLLTDQNTFVRRRATNALISVNNEDAVEPLIKALNDSEYKVRLRAAEALGNIGDSRAARPLGRLLNDDNSEIINTASKALNKMGTEGQDVIERHQKEVEATIERKKRQKELEEHLREKKAIEKEQERKKKELEQLVTNLGSVSSSVRNDAVNSLVELGEPAFYLAVRASNSDDSTVRRKSSDVFGLMRNPKGIKHLIRLLKDSNSYVRRRAANALILVNDENAVLPLIEALKDPEEKVKERAHNALLSFIIKNNGRESYNIAIDDSEATVKLAATTASINMYMGPNKNTLPAKSAFNDLTMLVPNPLRNNIIRNGELLKSNDPKIRFKAVKSIGKTKNPLFADILLLISDSDRDQHVKDGADIAYMECAHSYGEIRIFGSIDIDQDGCKGSGCGKCVDMCPRDIFTIKGDKVVAQDMEYCSKFYSIRDITLQNNLSPMARLDTICGACRTNGENKLDCVDVCPTQSIRYYDEEYLWHQEKEIRRKEEQEEEKIRIIAQEIARELKEDGISATGSESFNTRNRRLNQKLIDENDEYMDDIIAGLYGR